MIQSDQMRKKRSAGTGRDVVGSMRLFIAIPLRNNMKKLVRDIQNSFREQNIRGNYTPEENLHITLAFIGEYNDPDEVLEAMENVSFQPFSVTMDRVGSFDEIWWAGFTESEEMNHLARKLRRALAEAGVPYDRKKFKAHVTVLRKPRYDRQGRKIPVSFEPETMQVDRISLMRSVRGKNGMIYTELGAVYAERQLDRRHEFDVLDKTGDNR